MLNDDKVTQIKDDPSQKEIKRTSYHTNFSNKIIFLIKNYSVENKTIPGNQAVFCILSYSSLL